MSTLYYYCSLQSLVTHSHEEDEEANRRKNEAIYKGCVVLGGIYLFFITERMMTIVTDLRKKRQNEKVHFISRCLQNSLSHNCLKMKMCKHVSLSSFASIPLRHKSRGQSSYPNQVRILGAGDSIKTG